MKAQCTPTPRHAAPRDAVFDSIDYCINFWQGALDDEHEARQIIQEQQPHGPRHVRAFDDLA
jgi:hypothetical protein